METIGTAEAKNRLSECIEAVKAGQEFVITSHGKPVAKLVPYALDPEKIKNAREFVEWVEANRSGNALRGLSVKDLIEEGRR
ncbi:MAG: type II toxin-antitoxin system prevent-host-death family antitoxin [Pseudomonadota bacterium]